MILSAMESQSSWVRSAIDEVLGALSQRVYELELMLRVLQSRLDETRELLELVEEEQGGA